MCGRSGSEKRRGKRNLKLDVFSFSLKGTNRGNMSPSFPHGAWGMKFVVQSISTHPQKIATRLFIYTEYIR